MRLRPLILGASLLIPFACTSSDEKPKEETKTAEAKADKAPEPETKTAEDDGGADTKRVEIAKAEPPKVTVDDAGGEPKETLRFSPKAGSEETVVMTMGMTMAMSMGGQKMPAVTTPPMIVDARAQVDNVEENKMLVTYIVDGMRVGDSKGANPAMVKTLATMLDGMKSFEAHLELDRRGALLGGHVDVPQALPAPMQQMTEQLQQSFAQIQVPLPEEAVGPGAKWTAVGTIEQGGMKIEQTAHYEMVEKTDAAMKLKVAIEQKLIDNDFKPPGMPGVKAKINLFQSEGSGTLELSTDYLSPTDMATNVKLKMGMDIEAMGQKQKQDMEMDMSLQMQRK